MQLLLRYDIINLIMNFKAICLEVKKRKQEVLF